MTREQASDVLDDYDVNFAGHTAEEVAEAFDVAFKVLEQEPKWIPVSERLPEEDGEYLVTIKKRNGIIFCDVCTFDAGDAEKPFCSSNSSLRDYWKHGLPKDMTIAWMPLPEPYKAESEVEE